MMLKEFRLAVIGAERRGRLSLVAHQPEKGFRLAAAASLRLDRLEGYVEKCGPEIKLTTDYQEILKDPSIDAVFVCSPDHLHKEHALEVIRSGKHVFLEKPMAITIEDCDLIIREAEKADVKLYVGHNMRFFPVFQKMKELIDRGCIGRVEAVWCRHFISYGGDAYFRDWHSERRFTNGLLLQKGAHDIDIIHWLSGSYTKGVVGMGKLSVYNETQGRRPPEDPVPLVRFDTDRWPPLEQTGFSPQIDVEDHSMILLQLQNGVQASYQQCHYTPDDHRNYTIIGTEGRLENYGDFSMPSRWATIHLWNRRTGYSESGHEVFRIPHLNGEHGGADPLVVEDFLNFLRSGVHQGATAMDARMAVAAGCCGTDSLRSGSGFREVPPCPPPLIRQESAK